jgi:predicted DNA-binding protein YlxM (UPF0122 family)
LSDAEKTNGEFEAVLYERVRFGELFDVYSAALTAKQREACDVFIAGDMSASELGGELCMTRQGANDLLRRAKERLEEIDRSLGLISLRRAFMELKFLTEENAGVLPEDFLKRAREIFEKADLSAEEEDRDV